MFVRKLFRLAVAEGLEAAATGLTITPSVPGHTRMSLCQSNRASADTGCWRMPHGMPRAARVPLFQAPSITGAA